MRIAHIQKAFFSLALALSITIALHTQPAAAYSYSANQIRDLESNSATSFATEAKLWKSSALIDQNIVSSICDSKPWLGGYNVLGTSTTAKDHYFERKYELTTAHNVLYFSATFSILDDWELETDGIKILFDGVQIDRLEFSKVQFQDNKCGGAGKDLTDVYVVGTIPHHLNTLTITIVSDNAKPSGQASFGFRDISIIISNTGSTNLQSNLCALASVSLGDEQCPCPKSSFEIQTKSSITKKSVVKCNSCHQNCASCFGPSANECYECKKGTFFDGSACIKNANKCKVCKNAGLNSCNSSDNRIKSSPKADFSYEEGTNNLNIAFDASVSLDTDGTIAQYIWNFGEEESENNDATGKIIGYTYARPGTYVVNLTVVDNEGGEDTKSSQIIVRNVAPIANFTSTEGLNGLAISFDGTSSYDTDGSIITYVWDFGEPSSSSNTAYENNPSHSYAAAGIYTVTLTVTDDLGASCNISRDITVRNLNPVANFTFTTNRLQVSLNAQLSTDQPGRNIVGYAWNFGEISSTANTAIGTASTHTYARSGTYIVTLTIKNNLGLTATTSQIVRVLNFTAIPAGNVVEFDTGLLPDIDGSFPTCTWNFGDSNITTGLHVFHTYLTKGTYTVTLRATYNDGTTITLTQPVTITVIVGSGNLQFTLRWNRPGDGDLLVVTPQGKSIWYQNRGPNTGTNNGQLDVDDRAGTGPENIFWKGNYTPPKGTYYICFHPYSFTNIQYQPVTATIIVQGVSVEPIKFERTFNSINTGSPSCSPSATDRYMGSVTF